MIRPYCCPVCAGKATVPIGFYGESILAGTTAPEPCRSCNGSGVVWGDDGQTVFTVPLVPQPIKVDPLYTPTVVSLPLVPFVGQVPGVRQ